jgi:hypothetical protein
MTIYAKNKKNQDKNKKITLLALTKRIKRIIIVV